MTLSWPGLSSLTRTWHCPGFLQNNPPSLHPLQCFQLQCIDLFVSMVLHLQSARIDIPQISKYLFPRYEESIVKVYIHYIQCMKRVFKNFVDEYNSVHLTPAEEIWYILQNYNLVLDWSSHLTFLLLFVSNFHISLWSARAISLTGDLAISSFKKFLYFLSC